MGRLVVLTHRGSVVLVAGHVSPGDVEGGIPSSFCKTAFCCRVPSNSLVPIQPSGPSSHAPASVSLAPLPSRDLEPPEGRFVRKGGRKMIEISPSEAPAKHSPEINRRRFLVRLSITLSSIGAALIALPSVAFLLG